MTIAIRTDTLLTATLLLQYTDGQTDRRSVSTFTLSLLYPQSVISDREASSSKTATFVKDSFTANNAL